MVQLGKFGAFPAKLLLGLHYDITYEITPDPSYIPTGGAIGKHGARAETAAQTTGRIMADRGGQTGGNGFGQAKGKKSKKGQDKGGNGLSEGGFKSNPGWGNVLRPLKRENVVDAIVGKFI